MKRTATKKDSISSALPKKSSPSFLLVLLLATVGGLGWHLHKSTLQLQKLEQHLLSATQQKSKADQRRKIALLSASATSELKGWRAASPLASDFMKELDLLPESLLLRGGLFERHFSVAPLTTDLAGSRFPLPVRVLHVSDTILLEIYEAEKGSGQRSFPLFIERLIHQNQHPIKYEYSPLDTRWSQPNSERVSGKSMWSLSTKRPSIPLWKNTLVSP